MRDLPAGSGVIGDGSYDSDAILALIAAFGGSAHIPTPSHRKPQLSIDLEIYRCPSSFARFSNTLKHFRRIGTRYDKLARNFLAAVVFALTRLWGRAYGSMT